MIPSTLNWRMPGVALLLMPALGLPAAQAAAPVLTTLYSFSGGAGPYAGVTVGTGGALFGATVSGTPFSVGTVFELTPPSVAGGAWTETVLYSFSGSDGAFPYSAPILGTSGSLLGTTDGGGTYFAGAVYELTPPVTGTTWTEAVLYSFGGSGDGAGPYAGLIAGPGGVYYGTTAGGGASHGGTVFQLTPPSSPGGPWTETILYSFTGTSGDGLHPNSSPTAGTNGVLFGTTQNGGASGKGTVFELTPPSSPGGAWTETVLYSFTGTHDGSVPLSGLALATNGVLYGTTSAGGTDLNGVVFSLTPPASGTTWTQTVLHNFTGRKGDGANPYAGVVIGTNGGLFGTTFGGGSMNQGTVFELKPPSSSGGAWTEKLLHSFTGGTDGANPYAGLALSNSVFYGTTTVGGVGNGVVFELKP